MERKFLGAYGESLAAQYYRANGYRILAANYRTRQGEVDLIVTRDHVLVFVEVKTRGPRSIAAPREFVTAAKQRRIILAARHYWSTVDRSEIPMRFDVVEVNVDTQGNVSLNCIENAFSA